MSYKYQKGSTPDHVDSSQSNATHPHLGVFADATFVKHKTPADDAEDRHMRARKAAYGDKGVHSNDKTKTAEADKAWNESNRGMSRLMNSNINGEEVDKKKSVEINNVFDNLSKTANKAVSERKKYPKDGRTGPG